MSKMIPLPEQAPAASLRVGKTVMSWHWSVWLVSWVPSPWLPPFHSPPRRPLASSAKTAGLEVMRDFDGSALGISTTSIRKSAVRLSPGTLPMQPASSSSLRTPAVPEL